MIGIKKRNAGISAHDDYMKKALIAMSGGVDSSVAALLTKESGDDCIGATMKLFYNEDAGVDREKSCCSLDDVEDARSVCYRIGIRYYVFNFSERFKEDVMERFVRAYENGCTPNPCIDCNRYLKFDKLFQRMKEVGRDYIVTGHYARVEYDGDKRRYLLKKALDDNKDQRSVPGDFVDKSGNILGRHKGIIHYTLGQRRGLGIPAASRLYVCGISPKTNQVVLGKEEELFSWELTAGEVNLISCESLPEPVKLKAKIRYRHPEEPATAWQTPDGKLHVKFDRPQRAITKGQAVVLYDGDEVIGGGVIE